MEKEKYILFHLYVGMMRLSKRAAEADKRVICHHPFGVHSIFFAISQLCFVGKRKDGLFLSRFRGVKGGLFNYSAVSSSSVCFRGNSKGKEKCLLLFDQDEEGKRKIPSQRHHCIEGLIQSPCIATQMPKLGGGGVQKLQSCFRPVTSH